MAKTSRLPFDMKESATTFRILRSSIVSTTGLIIVIGFAVLAVFVWLTNDTILPYNPYTITSALLLPPSFSHLCGTDNLGRDVLSRVLAATPYDAEVPVAVLSIAVSLGLVTGTIAGYVGGIAEEAVMRITDIFLAFPGLVLALAIATSLGPGTNNAILALAPIWWPTYTRLARGETLSIKSLLYVEASRAAGHRARYIILHHIIPNIIPVLLVYATIDFGNVILTFSVLSFLGVGAQVPSPEWGLTTVLQEQYLTSAPWAPIVPALAILVVALGFSLLGDGLRDALDPNIRSLFG
ncbi:MAG TPA: ABC transporter permease [Candidatus Bathyarchaeia archaeon]|nr:ABC transporter permease [Candidatus Bathyarchaeia archaeon]